MRKNPKRGPTRAHVLWQVERHPRRAVAERLGIRLNKMSELCRVYCEGRVLLTDEDMEVLRHRRARYHRRPTPDQIRAQVRQAGPGLYPLGPTQWGQ